MQKTWKGLKESDAVVDIPGIGVYSMDTVSAMNQWNVAMETLKLAQKALTWVHTIDFTLSMPTKFRVAMQTGLPSKIRAIRVQSSKAEILDLVRSVYAYSDTKDFGVGTVKRRQRRRFQVFYDQLELRDSHHVTGTDHRAHCGVLRHTYP
ncbi:hypothetical protein L915_10762 [Phytophthora nicotianae]|uniref:Uncharacterized protein n=1 Tax=Phytophthora nicotianae TaxID=4792 RepID=W2GMQ7_PHYNI|nr:hypothetical protein L915_10762 [Phytophthora nicotianae]